MGKKGILLLTLRMMVWCGVGTLFYHLSYFSAWSHCLYYFTVALSN
jgi:hypothetical protein